MNPPASFFEIIRTSPRMLFFSAHWDENNSDISTCCSGRGPLESTSFRANYTVSNNLADSRWNFGELLAAHISTIRLDLAPADVRGRNTLMAYTGAVGNRAGKEESFFAKQFASYDSICFVCFMFLFYSCFLLFHSSFIVVLCEHVAFAAFLTDDKSKYLMKLGSAPLKASVTYHWRDSLAKHLNPCRSSRGSVCWWLPKVYLSKGFYFKPQGPKKRQKLHFCSIVYLSWVYFWCISSSGLNQDSELL